MIEYTNAQKEASIVLAAGAKNTLLYGGTRSGKTLLLVFYCVLVAGAYPGIRIAILRRYLKDVRESILEDTFQKAIVQGLGWKLPALEAAINRSEMVFRHGGSEIWFGGLDDNERVEKILGKEYGMIYFNEASQIPWQSVQVARTRLAQKVATPSVPGATPWRPRFLYDCNPPRKTHWLYRTFVEKQTKERIPITNPAEYVSFKMNPEDNLAHIDEDYLAVLNDLKGDNRERFLLGNFTESNADALWKNETMIDPFRVPVAPPDMERVVVGVDPAVTVDASSDRTGIVVCGMKRDGAGKRQYYVLADRTGKYSPNEWGRKVKEVYEQYECDRVVAEVNQGGDLVVENIYHIDENIPVKKVRATHGKIVRAEPIAALYERGFVHHVGEHQELEMELTSYDGVAPDESPDRMDALVWALWELSRGENEIDFGNLGSYV